MLRIQGEANGQVVLKISGRLDGENLAELKKLIDSEGGGRRIILDLRELTLVDHEAVGFLRDLRSANTKFVFQCSAAALPYKAGKLAPLHKKSYELQESQMSRRRKIIRKRRSRQRQLIARRIESAAIKGREGYE
jgi:hypothetical protein